MLPTLALVILAATPAAFVRSTPNGNASLQEEERGVDPLTLVLLHGRRAGLDAEALTNRMVANGIPSAERVFEVGEEVLRRLCLGARVVEVDQRQAHAFGGCEVGVDVDVRRLLRSTAALFAPNEQPQQRADQAHA